MIKLKKLLIDGQDYTDYAVWTLQGQETLDESLDLNYIELKGTKIETPFKPFLDVDIQIDDGKYGFRIQRLVESDTVTEIIGNKTYNHDLLFIEETKWLERLFVEKTVRQPLIHDYASLEMKTFVSATAVNTDSIGLEDTVSDSGVVNIFNSMLAVGRTYTVANPLRLCKQIQDELDFNLNMYGDSFGAIERHATLKVINDRGDVVLTDSVSAYEIPDYTLQFTPPVQGSYTFQINYNWAMGGTDTAQRATLIFDVSAMDSVEKKEDYTIRQVINELLETCITLREDEEPIFKLAEPNNYANASEDYKKQVQVILDTVSPEFTFSKMSLFEALKMIGDFAHFIPRLQNRKIYFDLLGQMEYAGTKFLGQYYSNVSNQGSNDFCNALDSQVNNLTNMDDEAQGSVSTPDSFGYRTLRTETGNVQITDTNLAITTEDNIEKIISLEIGYLSDGTLVGDITPFVYEEDEYKTLSSYTNTYPTSRMYAIKYKQGSKNITELGWQRDNPVSQALEGIAIKNIIYKKLNKPVNGWKNFWDNEDVFKLQYRLTYIPSTNTRVTQQKQNPDDMSSKPLYIAYNQGASKVSSNAYGENLKGTIAKLGNVAKTKMYILPSFDLIPKCGTLFDKDYYISVVKYEVYPNFIKCEVGLSKNYNNKSAYVEINSQLEFFEYNRNITIDRYVVYEEFCEITESATDSNEKPTSLINYAGLRNMIRNFEYEEEAEDDSFHSPITVVKARGYDDNTGALTEVVLPVISLGVGNSLLFAFHYEDTVSAGAKAFDTGEAKYQYFVKYTDLYGEMDKLKLNFGVNFNRPLTYKEAYESGDELPLTTKIGKISSYFETGDNKIVIRKGVGEAIHFTYQIHFVTKNKDFVIGSGLTRKSIFTNNEPKKFKLYALKNPINKFETKIDLTNAVEVGTLKEQGYRTENKWIKITTDNKAPDGNYKAWAIVQTYNNSNDLILGKNMEFKGGDILNMPAFTFKRRLK